MVNYLGIQYLSNCDQNLDYGILRYSYSNSLHAQDFNAAVFMNDSGTR